MTVDNLLLDKVARRSTEHSSRALSMLVGEEVAVKTTRAGHLPLAQLVGLITSKEGLQIVAFSQLISGVNGAALLIMEHADALHLVDALTKRPIGTTKVLANVDKSAIKETLNILSNSQLTALAEDLGITVNVMSPMLITRERIADVLDHLAARQGEGTEIIVFETTLEVTGQATQVTMLIVFDNGLAAIIEGKEPA